MKNDTDMKVGFSKSGIAKKFFLYLMLLSVLPLVIIGIASYELATEAITRQAVNFTQQEVDHHRDKLDLQLERVENLISDISGVEEITNALAKTAQSISSYTSLATKARIGYILNGYLSLGGLVSIDIYTLDGAHYHVGETLDTDKLREDVKSRLFTETLESGKFIHWAGVEDNINEHSPEQKVLTATSIFSEINRTTLEQRPVAMLVANYSLQNFNDAVQKSDSEGGAYFIILDNQDRIILHPDAALIGQQATPKVRRLLEAGNDAESVNMFGEKMVLNKASFDRNGWMLASFIPLAVLTKPASNIGIYTLAILGFCLAVISFTAYRYSRTVVDPIRRVIKAFQAFEKGTLDANEKIPVTGSDEITDLSKWYNSFLEVVDQQRKAQKALAESEHRFKDFAEATSDWFWECDANHIVTFVSDRAFETLPVEKHEILGRSRLTFAKKFTNEKERLEWEEHILVVNAQKPFRVNYPMMSKSGKLVFIQSSGKPVYDNNSNFLGYRGTGTDITKQIEAEIALVEMNKTLEKRVHQRTSELREEYERAEQLIAAIDQLNETVAIYDKEDRIIFRNRKFVELNALAPESIEFGVRFEDAQRIVLSKNMIPESIGREEEWLRERMNRHRYPKGVFEQEWGAGKWLLINEQRLPSGGSIILITDITERKQLEEQIRRAQKMEAVGQLTGGIAHDFNNILGIIQGNLDLLEDFTMEREQHGFLANAQKGVYRAADITRKLLAFSGKDVRKVELVSVDALIKGMENLIALSLTALITVETRLTEDLWPVVIDTGDFEDAVLNLSINARDAMPSGGVLSIETKNMTLDDTYIHHNPEGKTGEFVVISVSDTGTGMDSETKERVFEPFFTTKEQGKGTGLGLSMVYGFVQRSSGHLQIETHMGEGTTIRLYLPRATEKLAPLIMKKDDHSNLPNGIETILVVDDEKDLRDIAIRHLRSLGYQTIEAENGDTALSIIEKRSDVDMVFSDIVMPGSLNGHQLAEKAQKHQPTLKILLASGFANARENTVSEEEGRPARIVSHSLAKPYNKRDLATSIRAVLDEEMDD